MDFHAITPRGSELLMSVIDGVLVIVSPGLAIAQSPPQAGIVCHHDNKHDGDEHADRIAPEIVPERPGNER